MIYKVLCDNVDITEDVNSLKSSIQFENSTILIGNAPSLNFSIKIDNTSRIMDNLLDKTFTIFQDNELIATLQALETPEHVFKTLDLVLYDNLVKTNIKYETNTQMYPCKVVDQLQEMSSLLNLNIDYSLLPQNILNKEVNSYDTMQTIRIYLCWIAEMSCSNVFCKPDGTIVFKPVTKDIIHEIENDSYVYSFSKANKCDFTMIVDELHNFYCGDEHGNVLRTTQNNPYINVQEDIDYIFNQIGRITFDSVEQLKMRAVHGLNLGEIVHYKDYLTVFPTRIEKTYYNGEMAHDVVTVDGNVSMSLKSSYIGDQNYSAKVRKLMINVDENNQRLQIISQEQSDLQKSVGDLQISFDTIKLSVEQEITNSIYKIETGTGNIFDNCNQIISKKADDVGEKLSTNMPLVIDKNYMRNKDICISVNVKVEDGVVTEALGNYVGAEFTIQYADGSEQLCNTRWYVGQYDLQYLLQTSSVDVSKRIYAHFKVEDKEIVSVSNLKIIISLDAKNAVVSYPKVELGTAPTGIEFDIPVFRDNIKSLTTNFTEINQTVNELSLKAVSMDQEITTIKGNVSNVTTRLESAEIKIQPTNILMAVNEQIGSNGQLYTTKFILDKSGVHISGGGLDIKNNAGTKVFYADTNGNLIINNLTATNGKFSGSLTSSTFSGGTISGSSISGATITGGSITSNTTISVNTNLTVGNNIYLGTYTDRNTKKYIYMNDLFYISSRNDIIAMGVNNGDVFKGKVYVTSSGGCNVNGSRVNIIGTESVIVQASSISINGDTHVANSIFFSNDQQVYGSYYGGTNNLYVKANSGYLALYSHGNAVYADLKYIDSNWSKGKFYASGGGTALGGSSTSERWYRLYARNACNTSSDKRLKENIEYMANPKSSYYRSVNHTNVYEELFIQLKPSSFTMKSDKANRVRFGFIAQDVIEAINVVGLSIDDVDFVSLPDTENKEDNMYGLAYEEFIALNTYMIQKNIAKIDDVNIHLSEHDKEIQKLRNENAILQQELRNTQSKLDAFINGNYELKTVTREVA